jgi:hypothetical protein
MLSLPVMICNVNDTTKSKLFFSEKCWSFGFQELIFYVYMEVTCNTVMVIYSLEVDLCSNGSIWLYHRSSILMQSILSQPNFVRSCLLSTSTRLVQSSNRLLEDLVTSCYVDTTVCTQLQDDSKTHQIKWVCQGKMYLTKCTKMTPQKIKYLFKRILLLIACTWHTKHVASYLCQLVPLSPSSQSVSVSSLRLLLTSPSSLLPFHNMSLIHYIGRVALVRTHSQLLLVRCAAMHLRSTLTK